MFVARNRFAGEAPSPQKSTDKRRQEPASTAQNASRRPSKTHSILQKVPFSHLQENGPKTTFFKKLICFDEAPSVCPPTYSPYFFERKNSPFSSKHATMPQILPVRLGLIFACNFTQSANKVHSTQNLRGLIFPFSDKKRVIPAPKSNALLLGQVLIQSHLYIASRVDTTSHNSFL